MDLKLNTPAELTRHLTAGLRNLDAKDAEFARDLLRKGEMYGYSEKQLYWVWRLGARAHGESETPTTVKQAIGSLASVYAMFETAKAHLKHPAIVLGYQGGELRIYVATEQSRFPGAIQVKDEASDTWFGRVHQDGTFEQSRRHTPPPAVGMALTRFAADPIHVAAEHGHLTGRCCFCNRKLTDPKSTEAGYGPVCAQHFGLAWGARANSRALAGVTDLGQDDGPDPEDAAERQAVARAEALL